MFRLIHEMRLRIVTAPSFGNGKVIGTILFDRTVDGDLDGQPIPKALWARGVVPFLKTDYDRPQLLHFTAGTGF